MSTPLSGPFEPLAQRLPDSCLVLMSAAHLVGEYTPEQYAATILDPLTRKVPI